MAKTIEACIKGQNALLESPPGTSKTVNLICAAMGFIEHQKQKEKFTGEKCLGTDTNFSRQNNHEKTMPKLIICVQKQSEIKNVINKIKQGPYTPNVSILSSKRSLGINENVKSQKDMSIEVAGKSAVDNFENNLESTLKCSFKSGVDKHITKLNEKGNQYNIISHDKIMDIEDLHKYGSTHKLCPYYL